MRSGNTLSPGSGKVRRISRLRNLVDYTARLFRPGKATISAELAGIFDRLGTNARSWQVKMKKLRASRLLGRVFAASQTKLQEIAERLHVRYVVNLARCPAR